jgi:hypothetical protein
MRVIGVTVISHNEIEKIIKKNRDMKKFSSASRERIEILRNVLEYVAGNSNSIQVLLSENDDTSFRYVFSTTASNQCRNS